MKVIYEVFIEDDDDASLTRIELIFSELTALEKKILENNDLMIVEYYNKDSIKSEDSHPYIYVFSYYYTIDDDFIFAEYFSKEKLSKDTLDKMSGQIFDRLESF